jgi:hypothetical protein
MIFPMRLILTIFALITVFGLSCEKSTTIPEGEIHIYLLSEYESFEPSSRINENNLLLEKEPLIDYRDIISYDSRDHTFKISSYAQHTFKVRGQTIYGIAFALVANREVIYTGYFWPSFFSSICDWLTIDPIHAEYSGELSVQLGYPGLIDEWDIPDRRNDPRILSILRRDQKLRK